MEREKTSQEQKVKVPAGSRLTLSLRRNKDKDPVKHSPPKKRGRTESKDQTSVAEKVTERETCVDDNSPSTSKIVSDKMVDLVSSKKDCEMLPLDEEGEGERDGGGMADIETQSVHQTGDGLGEFFFCQICQKDLTRFDKSRRQQHINRCCDRLEQEKEEEEKKSAESAVKATFTCLLCGKSCKNENGRTVHMKSCAESKGVTYERLLQLMRKSKESKPIMEGEPSTSEYQEGTKEITESAVTRKSKRLATQSKNGLQSVQTALSTSRGDDDFTMPPPTGRPGGQRRRKRKRNNLQEDYLNELEEDQLQLAIAMSASLDPDVAAVNMEVSDTVQERGKRKQKRKKTAVQEVPPLLTVTSSQAQRIISQRADEILGCSETADDDFKGDDGEISCTPAFQDSELGSSKPLPRPAPAHDERKDSDEELFVSEKEERELPKLEDVVPVTDEGSSGDWLIKLNEQESTRERDVIATHVDNASHQVVDNQTIPCTDDLKEAPPTSDQDHALSFFDDMGQVEYPTLWELTAEDSEDIEDFYVPALVSIISPVKTGHALCTICQVEPCLALPFEGDYRLPASPSEPDDDDKPHLPRVDAAIGQLLSDMGSLVGSALLSDVMVQTQSGGMVPAHAVILAARCPKLRKVIEASPSRPISLDFSDFNEESVMSFLCFIYTGSSPSQTDTDTDLGQQFSLLYQKWYGDEDSEEREVSVVPDVDQDVLPQATDCTLQSLTDQSTVVYHTEGPELSHMRVLTSPPTRERSSLFSKSGASDQKCPPISLFTAEDTPVIIDGNAGSDDVMRVGESSPVKDSPETSRTEIEQSANEEETMEYNSSVLGGSLLARGSGSKHSTGLMDVRDTIGMNESWLSEEGKKNDGSINQGAIETVSQRSSRESSRQPSHISLSSYDSIDLLCETPDLPLTPQDQEEGGDSLTFDLFCTSQNRRQTSIGESGKRRSEDEREIFCSSADVSVEAEAKAKEQGIESESPNTRKSSSSSVAILAPESPGLSEREDHGSTNDNSPTNSFANYSPVYDYSFQAFEEDVPYLQTSLELERDGQVTPVNEKSIVIAPVSKDNIVKSDESGKRESEDACGGSDVSVVIETKAKEQDIENESPNTRRSSSSSVAILAPVSPHLGEKEDHRSTNDNSPTNHSPHYDYSFQAFEEDFPYPPMSLELELDQQATPVNERSVAMAPVSMDTVRRKPQEFKTPAECRIELHTDDDITPMPDFRSMRTPCLKGECARFGVKAMAKKKMIAKLSEIYEHTHPLVDEDGRIVSEEDNLRLAGEASTSEATKATKQDVANKKGGGGRGGKRKKVTEQDGVTTQSSSQTTSSFQLKQQVMDYLKTDLQLYQDVLLYKPTELSHFHTRLKAAGVTIAKEKLADILDSLCITYTIPRQPRTAAGTQRRQ